MIRVTAHAILKVRKENAMNDSLFAPLSNYSEVGRRIYKKR